MRLQYCSDVESLFLVCYSYMGDISEIGAHKKFEHDEFFMPELLLKELWSDCSSWNGLVFPTIRKYIYFSMFLDIKISMKNVIIFFSY